MRTVVYCIASRLELQPVAVAGKRRVGELLILRAVRSLSRRASGQGSSWGLGALVGLELNHGRRGLWLHALARVYRPQKGRKGERE